METGNIETAVRDVLLAHPEVEVGLLFGSAAGHALKSFSDIDVAVGGAHRFSSGQKMALIGDLALAAGRPVDLVDLSAVSGLILRESLTTGVLLVNRDPDRYAGFILKMWYNQADMMPNYYTMLKAQAEEFARG